MNKLIANITGSGTTNLVLIHGWAFNSKIWNVILNYLNPYFKLYLIDLPGHGKNYQNNMNLEQTIYSIYNQIPEKSIFLGWSLGGLIASQVALTYPNYVKAIITVGSSPYFIQEKKWPGVKKTTLNNFYYLTNHNFLNTIKNFLKLQSGDYISQKKINYLIKSILSEKTPTKTALKIGLNILYTLDLRKKMKKSSVPLLRIYGKLDSIVPYKIKYILDQEWPKTYSIIMNHSGHIPFISQTKLFYQTILKFCFF